MGYMFQKATAFNQNISGWDTSNVTLMYFMFDNATAFSQNLSGWNVAKVTDATSFWTGKPANYKPLFTV
jgi:surface protein